jgi:hypothetical protein
VLSGVRVARLDRVGQRSDRREVRVAQLLRSGALLLERLAQVGRVTLELVLLLGGQRLLLGERRTQALHFLDTGHGGHYPSAV